jgi:hypothetical protein
LFSGVTLIQKNGFKHLAMRFATDEILHSQQGCGRIEAFDDFPVFVQAAEDAIMPENRA